MTTNQGKMLEPQETRLVPRRVWSLLFLALIILWFLWPVIAESFKEPAHPDYRFHISAESLLDAPTTATAYLSGEWNEGTGGVAAAPGDEVSAIVLQVPRGKWDHAEIKIVADRDSEWRVRLRREMFFGRSQSPEIISSMPLEKFRGDQEFIIAADDFPANELAAPLTIHLEPTGGEPPAFSLIRGRISSEQSNELFPLTDAIALALLPFLCAMALRVLFGFGEFRSMMGGIGISLLLLVIRLRFKESEGLAWAVAQGLTLSCAISTSVRARGLKLSRRGLELNTETWRRAAVAFSLGAVLLAGLAARWPEFEAARQTDLGWDASGYVQIAAKGGGLYETDQNFAPWVREPLFPWILRLWFVFAPETTASARLAALAISLLMIAAVFAAGCRLFGYFVGIGGAAAIALLPHWAAISVEVLRLDLTVLLLMAFMAARLWLDEKLWKRAAGFGTAAAAMILTRISAVFFCAVALAWEVWRRKWRLSELALLAAIIIVPLLPHMWFNYHYRESGDPFYSSTVHTRYYYNREHIGEAGFPADMEEYREDPYVGEPMTTGKYLLVHHGIGELIAGHVKGYAALFVLGSPRTEIFNGHEWIMLPGLLGIFVLLRGKQRWVLVWFVIATFPYAFITSVHHTWRLGGEAQVLVIWIWLLGIRQAATWIWTAARKKKQEA